MSVKVEKTDKTNEVKLEFTVEPTKICSDEIQNIC